MHFVALAMLVMLGSGLRFTLNVVWTKSVIFIRNCISIM